MQRCFSQIYLWLSLLLLILFINSANLRNKLNLQSLIIINNDRVVISAPILTILYGADRYLAANLEAMRLASTSFDYYKNEADTFYLARAQKVVSQLNPCHEDNYYWANAFLSNSSAVNEGNQILIRASNCRVWDGMPSFFYGINEVFFNNNIDKAIEALTLSAKKWDINSVAINNMIVSLKSRKFNDSEQALAFLQHEYRIAKNERSKKGLLRRIARVKILIKLRKAQREYEKSFGKLESIEQLTEKQIISELPQDPLHIGFEIRHNRIEFKQINWSNQL